MATNDDQTIPNGAECAICFNILRKPKLLSCKHTFCKGCLVTLYRSQGGQKEVCCPLCRVTTQLPDGRISGLGTNNKLQALLDELSSKVYYCSMCWIKSNEKPHAAIFCSDCDKFMCTVCNQKHQGWSVFATHNVVLMTDVAVGNVTIKRQSKCSKHKDKSWDFFCEDCKTYACVKCRINEHLGHNIVEDEEHEQNRREKLRSLLDRLEVSKDYSARYSKFTEEQKENTKAIIQRTISQIETVRDAVIHKITESSNSLIQKCEEHEQAIIDKQEEIITENNWYAARIESAGALVSGGMTSRVDGDTLIAHDNLWKELENLLGDFKIDYRKVTNLTRSAAEYQFSPVDVETIPALGTFEARNTWVLGEETSLRKKDNMNGITPTPDGRMAVGMDSGGIDIYAANGQLQQTVLRDVKIRRMVFLSDGRCVVRDLNSVISVYTPDWVKTRVRFETLTEESGGWGGLAVDINDHIYVGFKRSKKIQVFTPAGGKPFREMACSGYEPKQLFTTKSNKKMVVHDTHSTKVIDKRGTVRFYLTQKETFCHPTVCHDDTVIIAFVRHQDGMVNFEHYTNELDHIETLITDIRIQRPDKRLWYFLREFPTGELAFCTPDKLYILQKSVQQ